MADSPERAGGPASIAALLSWGEAELADSPTPRLDAEVLLGHCLGVGRTYFYTWPERVPEPAARAAYAALIDKRQEGHPVAHLTGRQEFWSLPLRVSADTLIPRPETELLVEQALARIPDAADTAVLDLGTGTGAIALAIASERPRARVVAVEASAGALAVAASNREALDLGRVELRKGSWYEPVTQDAFDLIVSNPPYIGADEPEPAQGDVRFEPRSALIAPEAGLADLRAIIAGAPRHLRSGGWLLVEHGYRQGAPVRALMREQGLAGVATLRDLQGHERVTLGRRDS